ncbi:MAG: methyltransferase domain-containing protein, partial [Promethearchaeota archaeon]
IRKIETFCDIGIGNGFTLSYFNDRDVKTTGVDISPYIINHFQKKFDSLNVNIDFLSLDTEGGELDILKSINTYTNISSGGLYFGFIKKGNFLLSLEGAEFLLKNRFITNYRILSLNNEGERAILYGNDIVKENVIKYPQDLNKDDFLIIVNPQNEVIAIARALANKQELINLSHRAKVALSLIDKGYYLRKKQ